MAQYPLPFWSFQMTAPNQGIFILEGSQNRLEILVQEGKCSLLEPKNRYLDNVMKGSDSVSLFFQVFVIVIVEIGKCWIIFCFS